uniref:(California timema) hypothetical protein n=1 Tax=Timema californicum TaxID=61474 RepID=A0A7R9JGN1_TIMCA|nr:unnamed protein product [Timema californicum]
MSTIKKDVSGFLDQSKESHDNFINDPNWTPDENDTDLSMDEKKNNEINLPILCETESMEEAVRVESPETDVVLEGETTSKKRKRWSKADPTTWSRKTRKYELGKTTWITRKREKEANLAKASNKERAASDPTFVSTTFDMQSGLQLPSGLEMFSKTVGGSETPPMGGRGSSQVVRLDFPPLTFVPGTPSPGLRVELSTSQKFPLQLRKLLMIHILQLLNPPVSQVVVSTTPRLRGFVERRRASNSSHVTEEVRVRLQKARGSIDHQKELESLKMEHHKRLFQLKEEKELEFQGLRIANEKERRKMEIIEREELHKVALQHQQALNALQIEKAELEFGMVR